MKKSLLFVALIVVIVVASTLSCVPDRRAEQFARLEAELRGLSNSMVAIQQELSSTRSYLSQAQEQTKLLQKQLDEAKKPAPVTTPTTNYFQTSQAVAVPEPYYYYNYNYNYYPYGYNRPHRPFPPRPPSPFPPGPFPPAPLPPFPFPRPLSPGIDY
jgi:hypothetical protein